MQPCQKYQKLDPDPAYPARADVVPQITYQRHLREKRRRWDTVPDASQKHQRVNPGTWNILPADIFRNISQFTDFSSKRNFSVANWHIRKVSAGTIKSLRLSPPRYLKIHGKYPDNIPSDILVRILQFHPHAGKLIFKPRTKSKCSRNVFGMMEEPYLRRLIAYLKANPVEYPLQHVKSLTIHTLAMNTFSFPRTQALNRQFFQSLGHSGLQSVKIADIRGWALDVQSVKLFLERSLNLREIILENRFPGRQANFSFEKHTALRSVQLPMLRATEKMIESLKQSKDLQTLVFNGEDLNLKDVFDQHPWQLKKLGIRYKVITSDNELDEALRPFPHLEHLTINILGISNEGLKKIGENCPKLRILELYFTEMTDEGVNCLTQGLSHLEMFVLKGRTAVTNQKVIFITLNCPQLRILSIGNIERVERTGIDALIANCSELILLDISRAPLLLFEDFTHLMQNMKKLTYFLNELPQTARWELVSKHKSFLKTNYPHIKKAPSRKLEKLLPKRDV